MNALLACLELDMGCCSVLPDACRRRMEWCVLQLSVRVSPSCVRLRVERSDGERLSPRHNAYRLGAEGSVESVATRAAEAVEGQKWSSIVIFILGREGGFGTLCWDPLTESTKTHLSHQV